MTFQTKENIPVNMRRPYHKTRTVATFNWNERAEMFAYINRMNALGIGHFFMGGLHTIDWNEEAILDELIQPRDEATQAPLSPDECKPCAATSGSEQYRSSRESMGKEFSFR